MAFEKKPNTAIVFVESGLFCAKAVQDKKDNGNRPVLKVLINVDGVEKELALWFSTDPDTGEYKISKNGDKMLTGSLKVNDYVANQAQGASPTPAINGVNTQFDDDIPF